MREFTLPSSYVHTFRARFFVTGWTVRGSNAIGGEISRPRPDRIWDAHSPFSERTGSFPGTERSRRSADYPPENRAEVKERVELHLYCPSGPWGSVIGRNLC
jgi:hypothetical protein